MEDKSRSNLCDENADYSLLGLGQRNNALNPDLNPFTHDFSHRASYGYGNVLNHHTHTHHSDPRSSQNGYGNENYAEATPPSTSAVHNDAVAPHNQQNDDYYESISADESIGEDNEGNEERGPGESYILSNPLSSANLRLASPDPHTSQPSHSITDLLPSESSRHTGLASQKFSIDDLPFVPKVEFPGEFRNAVASENSKFASPKDDLQDKPIRNFVMPSFLVPPPIYGAANFDSEYTEPFSHSDLNSSAKSSETLSTSRWAENEVKPHPIIADENISTLNSEHVKVEEEISNPLSSLVNQAPSVDWLDENGDPVKGAFDYVNPDSVEDSSDNLVNNTKIEYVFSVKEKKDSEKLDNSTGVGCISNLSIEHLAGNSGFSTGSKCNTKLPEDDDDEEKKLYKASKNKEELESAAVSNSAASTSATTQASNVKKERFNRFRRNRFTEESKTAQEEEESTNKEPVKTTEELALESQAVTEILKDVHRGAERAREFGALGWQKCPVPVVNKTFLRNTLVSTLREPYRPPGQRGRPHVGLHQKSRNRDNESRSRSSSSSRSTRSRSSSYSRDSRRSRSQSGSSHERDDRRSRSPGRMGAHPRPWPPDHPAYLEQEWAAYAAHFGYQWYNPEMYAMYYQQGWPMDPYSPMYYGDSGDWGEYDAFYGRGRGRGGRGRGRARGRGGWGGWPQEFADHRGRSRSREESSDFRSGGSSLSRSRSPRRGESFSRSRSRSRERRREIRERSRDSRRSSEKSKESTRRDRDGSKDSKRRKYIRSREGSKESGRRGSKERRISREGSRDKSKSREGRSKESRKRSGRKNKDESERSLKSESSKSHSELASKEKKKKRKKKKKKSHKSKKSKHSEKDGSDKHKDNAETPVCEGGSNKVAQEGQEVAQTDKGKKGKVSYSKEITKGRKRKRSVDEDGTKPGKKYAKERKEACQGGVQTEERISACEGNPSKENNQEVASTLDNTKDRKKQTMSASQVDENKTSTKERPSEEILPQQEQGKKKKKIVKIKRKETILDKTGKPVHLAESDRGLVQDEPKGEKTGRPIRKAKGVNAEGKLGVLKEGKKKKKLKGKKPEVAEGGDISGTTLGGGGKKLKKKKGAVKVRVTANSQEVLDNIGGGDKEKEKMGQAEISMDSREDGEKR